MAKDEKRQQKRVGITVQLIEGVDDDLIQWLSRLPKGERQSTIKRLLRRALRLPMPEDAGRDVEAEWRRWAEGQIVALQDETLKLRGELSRRPALGIDAPVIDDGARLAQDEIERRANRVDKAAW